MSKTNLFASVFEIFDNENLRIIIQLFAESGFEPPTLELPIQCSNHYTNSGEVNKVPT
jgi:hypothetical protein